MNRPFAVRLVVWTLAAAVAAPGAASVPAPVSPGGLELVRVSAPCPTFSWSAVEAASGYELVAYAVPRVGEAGAAEADPVLHVELPAGASSWSPDNSRCLARGRDYAWVVRALGPDGRPGPWSPPRLFSVAAAPTPEEAARAAETLRLYLELVGTEGADGARRLAAAPPPPSARVAAPDPAPVLEGLPAAPAFPAGPPSAPAPLADKATAGGPIVLGGHFLGTSADQSLELRVDGERALLLVPHADAPNVVGGAPENEVIPGVRGGTIAGGGLPASPNRVTDDHGTVGGGYGNVAGNAINTTGDAIWATVGGGNGNQASGPGSTVAGGGSNQATQQWTTIGGGIANRATDLYATVPGGRQARATHWGEMAYSAGFFTNLGDAQTSLYVMRGATDGISGSVELFLEPTFSRRLTVATNRVLAYEILAAGVGAAGDSAGFRIAGVVENVGGTVSLVGNGGEVVALGRDDLGWTVVVTADDTLDALKVLGISTPGVITRWVATVRTTELELP